MTEPKFSFSLFNYYYLTFLNQLYDKPRTTCGASLRFQCQDDVARLMVLPARPVLLHHDFHYVLQFLSSTHVLSPTADFEREIV